MSNLATRSLPRKPPLCVECAGESLLVVEDHGPRWYCSCGAYAYCERGTIYPAGRPCNDETRLARREAHEALVAAARRTASRPAAKATKQAYNRARAKCAKLVKSTFMKFRVANLSLQEARTVKAFLEALS